MKKGLVLEGGAMRGMFTSGVLDVFMENGIVFDGAVGVSAGATFGCNYKSKQPGRAIRYNKRFSKNWKYGTFLSFFLTGNIYETDFCYNQIPNKLDIFDVESYKNNPMEFYVVVSDAENGKPIYKKLLKGDENDLKWMQASASMPLVSRPVKVDGYTLLDGGMTDSVPLKFFESLGYDRNVVILTQPRNFVKKPTASLPLIKIMLKKYPRLVEAMSLRHEVYNEETKYCFEKADKGEVLVICPEKSLGISRTEKNPSELERVYQEGRKTAENILEKVKIFLSEK
ncbi:MAG: patatin family protein [Treponema sp.]|nr:patatin family protein [Treponema sp.]